MLLVTNWKGWKSGLIYSHICCLYLCCYTHSHTKDWFAAKNICDNEAAENPTKILEQKLELVKSILVWSVYIVVKKTNIKLFGCIGHIILEFISISIWMKWISLHFCWCIDPNKVNRSCGATLLWVRGNVKLLTMWRKAT